jgi:saccharopine dehydrogenase (NAD+, L-lysine forming)
MSPQDVVFHLRSETKALEKRSACECNFSFSSYVLIFCLVSPASVKALIEAGYTVNVEHSSGRIFDDKEFEHVGAKLVPEGSWVDAPKDHIIIGLKELENKDCLQLLLIGMLFSDSCSSIASHAHSIWPLL